MAKARLTADLRDRLNESHRRYKTSDTEVIVSLIEAYLEAVEEADAVRFPVTVLMDERAHLRVAEDRLPPPKSSG